jgi:hypothetical protein
MSTNKDQKSEAESDSLNEQGAIPRRNVLLGGAGAAAAGLLGACGGGDELDGDLPQYTEIRSEVAAYTLPSYLLPSRGVYQVEVVFATQDQVTVDISDGIDTFVRRVKRIATKARREGLHHIIHYAAFRIDSSVGRDLDAAKLFVTQTTVNSSGVSKDYTTDIGAGSGGATGTTQNEFVEMRYYSQTQQTEYRFYTKHPAGNKSLICVVRFFLKSGFDGQLNFLPNQYVRTVANNASVPAITRTSGSFYKSQHLETPFSRPRFESQVLKDPKGTHRDTVVLPDQQRGDGQYMLIPTLHHASLELQPFVTETLKRHAAALGKSLASAQPLDGEEDVNQSNFLHNEILRLAGGESLIENLNKKRNDLFHSVEGLFRNLGTGMAGFLESHVAKIPISKEFEEEADRLLQEAESTHTGDARIGGFSFANSIAVQLSASLVDKNFPIPGLAPGGAIRISFPLRLRAMVRGKNVRNVSRWRISASGRTTYKFSLVFILKLASLGPASIDIEFTLNFAVNKHNVMIESMVFDPVFDVDTRGFLSQVWARLLSEAAKATSSDLGQILSKARTLAQ